MGLEPMTSPLPRECSTTELHQPLQPTSTTSLQPSLPDLSYRERIRPSTTRKAKKPSKTHVSCWIFPGSIVRQAPSASKPIIASATHIRPLLAGLKSTTLTESLTNN